MYSVVVRSVAENDLAEIYTYITEQLKAPQAAADFLTALDVAVARIQEFPYSCKVYHSSQLLEEEVRMLPVKNYYVFYAVAGSAIEIRRILYAKRDLPPLLS